MKNHDREGIHGTTYEKAISDNLTPYAYSSALYDVQSITEATTLILS